VALRNNSDEERFLSFLPKRNRKLTIFLVENVCERVSQTAFFFYFSIKQWHKELKRKIQNVFVFIFREQLRCCMLGLSAAKLRGFEKAAVAAADFFLS
jgi:hypothetical protein